MTHCAAIRRPGGFTLTELAIVILIFGLLLSSLLALLSAQTLARENSDTQRTLDQAREAVIGFAVKFGRLPCPAAPGATGSESFVNNNAPPTANRACTNNYDGFLPAIDLGLSPTDAQGYLLDSWGNRVRYAVSQWIPSAPYDNTKCPPNTPVDLSKCPLFTTANGLVSYGLANIPQPLTELRVCDNAACSNLVFRTPAVIFSPGKSSARVGAVGTDEQANADSLPGDATFVMHEPRDSGAPGGQFDDLMVWIPPAVLYNRLISAGAF